MQGDSLNSHPIARVAGHVRLLLGTLRGEAECRRRCGRAWTEYKGSADAIYQNLNIITDEARLHLRLRAATCTG